MVLCFYDKHISRSKLWNNFCVSDFLCNFLMFSLNLKILTNAQFDITIIFITKEASWCKFFKLILLPLNFICVSVFSKFSIVSILPCSALWSISKAFFFRQFGFIVFSNAIFMKDGFIFHK